MKISIVLIIVFSILFITCNNHVFDNPVDPESEDFSGEESVDTDGDGIGSYEDVDEITIEGPENGAVITDTASPILTIQLLNPEVVTAYHIQISTDSNFVSNIVFDDNTLISNVFTVPAGTLANNTTYYWRAKAFDGTKWSDGWSTVSSFVVDVDTEVPMFPSPADGGSVGDATPVMNWEDAAGANGYHIQINTASDFTGIVVADDNILTDSEYLLVTPLENNSTYYWRVMTKNTLGLLVAWSNTWSFTVDVTLDVPTNPNPSNGSSIVDTTPLLEWGNVTGASSYEIEISLDNDFSSILESATGFFSPQYQMVTLLSDNTTYYWRVRIYDEDAIIGNWTTWTFSVNINEPVNPSPSSGGVTIYTTPVLDWDNITDALNYEIEISAESNFSSPFESESGFTSSQYQITSILSNNTSYYWRVRVQNDDNVNGDWSTWNFTVDMAEPVVPSPVDGGGTIDTTPLLNWEDVAGASIYEIAISTLPDFSSDLITNNGLNESHYQVETALTLTKTYYWKVRIQNVDGLWGDWSDVWSFLVEIEFVKHIIYTQLNTGFRSVYSADVNSDGSIDVLSVTSGDDVIWYENDGNENFTPHIIDNNFSDPYSVHAADVDDDGDIDILGAAAIADDITWWENDGSENFTEHTIDTFFNGAWSVHATDVDGDGDIDVLGAARTAADITWWENDGSENFTEHTIDGNYDGANCVYAADIDGDGDMDILGTAEFVENITWWENDGSENFTKHTINAFFDGVSVYATDLDSDGDMDIIGAARSTDEITWWENDGNENFTEHTIDALFDAPSSIYAADIDDDGDIDVLGSASGADEIAWWINDGNENFTKHTIDENFVGAYSIYTSDVDGDGDMDILGAAHSGNELAWWENMLY